MSRKPTAAMLRPELIFSTSRSGGPGGQNVNKVNTKVTIHFNVWQSSLLSQEEKSIIAAKLKSRINSEGELLIIAQEGRSQLANKENALKKLDELLVKAFHVQKKRKPTKPAKSAVKARLDSKKMQSEKKKSRQKLH